MKRHLNTLFVTTPRSYLRKEGQSVVVRVDKQTKLRVPIHNISSIVCFGRVSCSPVLMGFCAQSGVAISFLTEFGRFLASVNGYSPGNVLLRREQYRQADDHIASAEIARSILIGKIHNSRTVYRRAARDATNPKQKDILSNTADRIATSIHALTIAPADLDSLRGIEGDSANTYFHNFKQLFTSDSPSFSFHNRNRRPPRDPVNALLSFLYTMLTHDARAACEAAGLDAAVGFLHRDRPGRPSLALDLIEELRPIFADRLALSLINRQQIQPKHFDIIETGAVLLKDDPRKTVLAAYQQRKQDTITHPFLGEKITLGILPHIQARLLARYLRGDIDAYPPFLWK